MRGRVIALEGISGSGKSSQLSYLIRLFDFDEIKVLSLSFPYRGVLSYDLLDSISKNLTKVSWQVALYAYCVHFWEVNQVIQQNIQNGTSIIIDSFVYSAIATLCGTFDELNLKATAKLFNGLILPDITFYIHVSPAILNDRCKTESIPMDKINKMKDIFTRMMNQDTWRLINGNQTEEKVCEDIQNHLYRSKTFAKLPKDKEEITLQ